jgi:hypothetical protein
MTLDIYIGICLIIMMYCNLSIFFPIACISVYYNYEFYSHIKEVEKQINELDQYIKKVKLRD